LSLGSRKTNLPEWIEILEKLKEKAQNLPFTNENNK